MRCPFCNAVDSRVVDSRVSQDFSAIRRRRQCEVCGRRFTTYERAEEVPIIVVKKDGSREEFRRSKLLDGMLRACHKRPVSVGDLEVFVERLEATIHDHMMREVESRWLGERVMGFLREKDPVAYVRFASVYRQFTDITAFQEEVRRLLGSRDREEGTRGRQ